MKHSKKILSSIKTLSEKEVTTKVLIKFLPQLFVAFIFSLSLGIFIALTANIDNVLIISGHKSYKIDRRELIQKLKKIDRERTSTLEIAKTKA